MRNVMIILVNMLPCFLLSQCPKTTHQDLISTYQAVAANMYDSYWPEWENVPKPLLLIDDNWEYLFGTDYTDSTFQVNCEGIYSRPATLNKYFLATFPLINYKPTILIGTPENTHKTSLEWTITLLHEHFHQLQFSHPDYQAAQKALNLDKGDQTGMWMLNHPFPYEAEKVIHKIDEMVDNLLSLHQNTAANLVLSKHLRYKQELKTLIGDEHYKYLNLQLWQEGYARFMELSILEYWIAQFDQINQDQFQRHELETYLRDYETQIRESLISSPIYEIKRVYFYSLGATEAMLIRKLNPDWKDPYFDVLFTTDNLLKN